MYESGELCADPKPVPNAPNPAPTRPLLACDLNCFLLILSLASLDDLWTDEGSKKEEGQETRTGAFELATSSLRARSELHAKCFPHDVPDRYPRRSNSNAGQRPDSAVSACIFTTCSRVKTESNLRELPHLSLYHSPSTSEFGHLVISGAGVRIIRAHVDGQKS